MLLSLEKKFLFVHVAKAAGSSIRTTLDPYCVQPQQSWVNRFLDRIGIHVNHVGPFPRQWFRTHDTARTAQFWLPRHVFDGVFKFAFVRNPWDRMVSMYSYILLNTDHHRHGAVSQLEGFEDFLKTEFRRRVPLQLDSVSDRRGNVIVDFIGRFETLEADMAEVCRRIGIEYRLVHRNRAPHEPYQKSYNHRTRKLVADYFARDIEYFGYDFEGFSRSHRPQAA